jgi:hypothetical protein
MEVKKTGIISVDEYGSPAGCGTVLLFLLQILQLPRVSYFLDFRAHNDRSNYENAKLFPRDCFAVMRRTTNAKNQLDYIT